MDLYYETGQLQHHGIKGMKWGIRRYQNKDGSLTPLGAKRSANKGGERRKARENIKDQRAARLMAISKQLHAMRQESLDRESARRLAASKLKLDAQKAREDARNQAANRKLSKEKLKMEDDKRRQDALDREADRKLAKDRLKAELDKQRRDIVDRVASRKLDKYKFDAERKGSDDDYTLPDEEMYELPEEPQSTRSNGSLGKALTIGTLAVVGGTIAVKELKRRGIIP